MSRIHPSTTPCFRTRPDGGIPLRPDWAAITTALASMEGDVVAQTRHAFGRLIGQEPSSTWKTVARSAPHAALGESLLLERSAWTAANAYLDPCPCCDIAGRIEIHSAGNAEILQVHATDRTSLVDWSGLVASLAAPPDSWPELTPTASVHLPVLHSHAIVCGDGTDLPALLAACRELSLALRWRMRLPGIAHKREFVPERSHRAGGVLTVSDGRSSCQLLLPAVSCLALAENEGVCSLHLLGPGHTVLLSLEAADRPTDVDSWHQLLRRRYAHAYEA